ncbi:glycosyl hydrolase family 28-related protein [Cohnella herbarum]|uniref:Rhamnogalacturonase A/B/Epimerase-like pectate lyase domain-containing protein n=1 Tax=Cohnella herbarum TaxID=2728023 RepID=A0A7Z2VKM4_9BACL|nr:glycosyl hydrolase family 28-related protein [Cohnella herbarum]QJD84570.1 hypothetical protein HH215_16220 [Cohnella herbarum]
MRGNDRKPRFLSRMIALGLAACLMLPAGLAGAASQDSGPPAISYATEGVDEGGTFVLTGDRFTESTEIWLFRPAKDDAAQLKAAYGNPASPLPAIPPEGAVKTTVVGTPEEHLIAAGQIGYPNLSLSNAVVPTIVWAKNSAGWSSPYLLNRPELYFASASAALPGERIRVFGRNLETKFEVAGPDYDYPVALKNRVTGKVEWAQALMEETQEQANVKPYVLNVLLPAKLPAGTYDLAVHVLYGGAQGWSEPIALDVAASRGLTAKLAQESNIKLGTPQSGGPVNVRIDSVGGLKADGFSDDTDKIQKAIDQTAAKGGGIVLLPPGNLAISKTIRVKPNVVLAGSGKAATQLVVNPDRPLQGSFPIANMFASPTWVRGFAGDYGPYLKDRTPMVWLDDKTGLQDLSVLAGAGADIGVLVGNENPKTTVRDTFLRRTEIVNRHMLAFPPQEWWGAYMGGVLVVSSTDGFTLADSRVVGDQSLFMLSGDKPHKHARIANNEFETAVNNSSDNIFVNSIAESIIENNRIENGGRAITSQMGMWRNWISGNVISHTGGRANGSEMLMSEDGYVKPLFAGKIKSATTNSVTVGSALGLKDGEITTTAVEYYAFVTSGTGMGQYRKVVGNTADGKLDLDRKWTVVPDSGSRVDVIRAAVKNLFVNNWISDSRGNLQFSYGAGLDNVVAGNQINGSGSITVFGGIEDWTDSEHPFLAITAYNQIYANYLANSGGIFLKGNVGKGHSYGDEVLADTGGFFANTVRRNQIWAKTKSGDINQYYNTWFGVKEKGIPYEGAIDVKDAAFTVVDGNYAFDASIGVRVSGGKGTIIVNNRMDEVKDRIVEQNGAAGTVKQAPSWENPY